MVPLQMFEEGGMSKTFKAGGAKSFEGGRRGRVQVVPVQPWVATPPISLGDKQPCTRVELTKAQSAPGKMHQR